MKKENIKVWDWTECEKKHSKEMVKFLRSVQGTAISEEDFAALFAKVPYKGNLSKAAARGLSRGRADYRSICKNFPGFFIRQGSGKERKEPGHSVDVNGYCNKGCC